MESILYLMKLDWYWIKQRPQFIAEGLSKYYDVNVIYKYSYKRSNLQHTRTKSTVNLHPLITIPNKLTKYSLFKKVSEFFFRQKVQLLIKEKKPKAIYFTTPLPIELIPKNYDGKIVYDCMDDNLNLDDDPTIKDMENKLIERADDILVTSVNLQDILLKRYGYNIKDKLYLVRNGFAGKILDVSPKIISSSKVEIAYIGTVAKWFDFNLLEKSLKKFSNLEYTIIGPIYDDVKVVNPRIHFLGTIEHERLYENIKSSRALIMPFKLNKIVESVDPVKLYEYINFNKDIITIEYPEVERFSDFVYFYKNEKDFFAQIRKIMNTRYLKFSQEERKDFLLQNNWNKRSEQIYQIIEGKYTARK